MSKKFLHIGIGRTSNITLINEIYPIIAQSSNYKFFHFNEHLQDQININYEKMKLREEIDNEINFNENTIISDERLIGWNPYDWKKFAEANLKMFGKDTSVLILLRDPHEYINSMYTRQCLVHGNLMLPDVYFLLSKNYNKKNDKTFFLQDFSYEKLKKIYEEKFNEVIFLDYSDIKEMYFFANYFKLNLNDKKN